MDSISSSFWPAALLALLALTLATGCTSFSDPEPPSPPRLQVGDQATYNASLAGNHWTVDIEVLGNGTAMRPSGNLTDAILARVSSHGGDRGRPRLLEVAVTPETHRLIRIKVFDDCKAANRGCRATDITWGPNGNPWKFGSGILGPAWRAHPAPANLTVPGPRGTLSQATYRSTVTDTATLRVVPEDIPRVEASTAFSGTNLTITQPESGPFPTRVELYGGDWEGGVVYDLTEMKPGSGQPLGTLPTDATGADAFWSSIAEDLGARRMTDKLPPRSEANYPEPFPLELAMKTAKEDERFARFLREHPDAAAIHGSFRTGGNNTPLPTDPTDATDSQIWSWDLTFAAIDTGDAWEVEVNHEEHPGGREETYVESSQQANIPPGTPENRSRLHGEHVPLDVAIHHLRSLDIPQPEAGWSFHALGPAGWYDEPRYAYRMSFWPRTDEHDGPWQAGLLDDLRLNSRTGMLEIGTLRPETIEDW